MAKLDNAEKNERQHDIQPSPQKNSVADPNFTTMQQLKDPNWKGSREGFLTDSILDGLEDEPFEELPPSQCQFHEQLLENAKRSRLQDGDKTSTPFRNINETAETGADRNMHDKNKRPNKARRSMMDQLKRTMVCNAAAPTNVSRTVVLKEAVVSEEISVAMQAMETLCAETTDLGPFFGLPTKVKDLMYTLRGIKNLYGDPLFPDYLTKLIAHVSFTTKCIFFTYSKFSIV